MISFRAERRVVIVDPQSKRRRDRHLSQARTGFRRKCRGVPGTVSLVGVETLRRFAAQSDII
jgi:hypothetical protein